MDIFWNYTVGQKCDSKCPKYMLKTQITAIYVEEVQCKIAFFISKPAQGVHDMCHSHHE